MTEEDVAVLAAEAAARIQREAARAGGPTGARQKGAVDWVTDVDLRCEAAVREVLARHTPEIPVLGEEGGGAEGATTRWVVDPLDGTTNFVRGFPVHAVSVGPEVDGEPRVGAIIDVPRGVVYRGTLGRGATANGAPLRVSDTRDLGQALCATGFPYDRQQKAAFYLRLVEAFLVRTQGVRRAGAAALDLSWLAAGHVDVYWEFHLGRWDVVAGIALVRAAGGTVDALPGFALDARPCPLATNGWLQEAAAALIRQVLEERG
ncbi:MAG: inositol monophosphatase family protein [Myxococcota bacterium]